MPEAKVFKDSNKQRSGKGFSISEMRKAGSSLAEAVRFGIPVDHRRKTTHDENIEAAKKAIEEKRKKARTKRKPKKPEKTEERH